MSDPFDDIRTTVFPDNVEGASKMGTIQGYALDPESRPTTTHESVSLPPELRAEADSRRPAEPPRPNKDRGGAQAPDVDEELFPALERLKARKGERIPYIQQLHATDCGAASLAMVLGYFGHHVALDELRQAMGVGRDGLGAPAIAKTAERYGLHARGISLDVDSLDYLPSASILHWEFNHFVVFEKVSRKGVHLVDPAMGRRIVPLDRFGKAFTGVALLFEPTDAFELRDRGKSKIWAYIKQLLGQKHLLHRVVTTSILLRLFALAVPILTAMIVDRVVPREDRNLLLVVGAGLLAMVVFKFITDLIRAHLMLQLRTNLDTRMTLGFIDHLMGLRYDFFQRRSAGDLMMRVNSNATIRQILTTNTLTALLDGVLVFVYLGAIFLFSPMVAALVFGIGTLQIFVFLLSRRKIRDLMAENLEAQARSQSYLVQMMAGVESIKATGAEQRTVEHWSNLFVDELNVSLARGRLDALVNSLMGALQMAAPLMVLGWGAIEVMAGKMSLGSMLAVNALALAFLSPLSSMVNAALQLQLLGGYIERIDDVLSAPPEQDRASKAPAPKLRGQINVEKVSFKYQTDAPMVVRDVDLTVEPGKAVAIVGRSGSGKSTLASLMIGLYPSTHGRILYDGRDLWEMDLSTVRRQLGVVPQSPYIFGASVRENIALASPMATFDQIVDAARVACIHEDVIAMPMGYDTLVTDGGASLSGGQRQRLALARALLARPAVLILDEATSALDAATERRVVNNLIRIKCTRVIVAHRLSTIADADEIIVMDDGRIVERGHHSSLIAQGGYYASLVAAQQEAAEREVVS